MTLAPPRSSGSATGGSSSSTPENHAAVLRMLAKRHHDLVGAPHPVDLSAARAVGHDDRWRPSPPAVWPIGPLVNCAGSDPTTRSGSHAATLRSSSSARSATPDRQLAELRTRIVAAVRAADTTVTDIHGVGPIVAAYLIGYTGDITRFATKAHYARYNATAPLNASSGPNPRHRLNDRGNRQLNHAIHLAAVTQIAHDTAGRDYYLRKHSRTTQRQRSAPRAQAAHQRRRLRPAARRRTTLNQTRAREGTQGRLLNPAWPANP